MLPNAIFLKIKPKIPFFKKKPRNVKIRKINKLG